MRFGLFFQAPESPGHSHAERYAEMFDRIALAESLGFDVAWLAEIHFGGVFSLLSFDQGSMLPRDEIERAMRRFADRVMPKLA